MSKSKSKRSKRSRGVVDRSATTDVVSQLECAFKNPHAALIGAVVGGLVPWFGRTLAHDQIPAAWADGSTSVVALLVAVVLGCALFSALSVYKFGKAAFGDSRKALGFVLALEGVMLVSTGATSNAALFVLILINAVANGSVIALSRAATCKQREADVRRAATRARNRGAVVRPSVPAVPAAPTAARRRPPIEVVEVPVEHAPELVKVPRSWSAAADDTVIDAEIVSEEKIYS